MTWYCSSEREVNWRWTTSWRSLLTSELACDSMSQCMAVLFPVPVLATGGLSLAVQRGSKPTGLRFVQWIHQDPREATRADPPPRIYEGGLPPD